MIFPPFLCRPFVHTCCCSWVWRVPRAPGSAHSSARWAGAQARPGLGRWIWQWCRRAGRWTAEVGRTLLELGGGRRGHIRRILRPRIRTNKCDVIVILLELAGDQNCVVANSFLISHNVKCSTWFHRILSNNILLNSAFGQRAGH